MQEDYLHLVKVLATRICKSCRSKPVSSDKWTVTDATRSQVSDLVNVVMSQCSTYSPESDVELGLTEREHN